jgi:hypothetical protein
MNYPFTMPMRPWRLIVALVLFGLLTACGGGSSPTAPTIDVQPVDTSVVAGTAAALSVRASGTNVTYQWQSSSDGGQTWVAIAGATSATYTTPVTSAADDGRRFRVIVSGAGITVTSSAVTLTVTAAVVAPVLIMQPTAQTADAPDPARFSVTASGTAPSYQWQRSTDGGATWADIAGASAATYNTGATSITMSGQRYRVVVSNSGGSVISAAAALTVNPPPAAPAFTTHPADQSVIAGSAAAFTVAATGAPAPALQWQRSSDGGVTWADIAAAIDADYNTGPTTALQNGERYRAVAVNGTGSATSNAATLSVALPAPPSFTAHPSNVTIVAGQSAQFIVGVTGTPTPTLQWQLSTDSGASWSNINGATGDVLSLPAGVPLADNGRQFRAVASNGSGSAASNAAVLTVNPSWVPSFQFNLFGFNQGPAVFLLYGGSVKDNAGTITCSGYAAYADPCPKWRGDYPSGTSLTLTATPWPNFRVSRWIGGDCGSPGTATSVTLIIDHNSNCFPQFEPIPGSTFSVSAVPAGAWIGQVVEMVADRYGNLVIPDSPRISCGPLASAQICSADFAVADSPYTVLRLRAFPLWTAPVGVLHWSCSAPHPEDPNAVIAWTATGPDINLGPIHGNTACSVDLVPTP